MQPMTSDHTLLGIWAHPDDEAYLSAGLMARAASAGARVVCCYATAGESGTNDPDRWPPGRLAAQRDTELRRALALVGAEPPRYLGHADGRCAEVATGDAVTAIDELLGEVRPTHLVTFGSDGITGHPDHRAVSNWVLQTWIERRSRSLDVPTVLLAAMEPDWLATHRELHEQIDLFGYGPARATVSEDVVVRVRLDDQELALKRRVLAAHASQTDALAALVGEDTYRNWWASEAFRAPDSAEIAGLAVAV